MYGPAEVTLVCTYHLIDPTLDSWKIPLGRSLPKYHCLVVDKFLQPVVIGQEGDLLVSGVGIFAGYLGREDLTARALVKINGRMFYRSGDFVRLDNRGLLCYLGRTDYQIKLHGQRIEVGEIEHCLLRASSNVSNCVVVKWGEDYLIAYVQSTDINKHYLRDYCRSHLPSFMVPSIFIVLEQFPLNPNGKLDRKRLPPPNFSAQSPGNEPQHTEPMEELELSIHALWCELLNCTQISITESIFNIGGHSLLLMQLYHRYKTLFDFDEHALGIAQLFQYPSIADHARLIGQSTKTEQRTEFSWLSLHLTEGINL